MPAWNERYSTVSNAAGTNVRRVFVSIGRQPNLLTRILTFLIAAVVFGLVLLILIPIMVVGAIGLGVLWLYVSARTMFSRAKEPDGAFDQRENVRVIRRDDQ